LQGDSATNKTGALLMRTPRSRGVAANARAENCLQTQTRRAVFHSPASNSEALQMPAAPKYFFAAKAHNTGFSATVLALPCRFFARQRFFPRVQ